MGSSSLVCFTWAEVSLSHGAEDLIDGGVGRQRAVEDGELPLQALRDVVPAAARLDHGRHQLSGGHNTLHSHLNTFSLFSPFHFLT